MRLGQCVRRRSTLLLVSAIAAFALVGLATAENYKIQLTPAGQAAARATVLKKADFAPAPGWKGGLKKADLSDQGPLCPNFKPKESDLVINGVAESDWLHPSGFAIVSLSAVLRTAGMVELDWQRSVDAPTMLPCMSKVLVEQVGANARLVSARRVAFPRLATLTDAFRINVGFSNSKARMVIDLVFLGSGRTEMNLVFIAPLGAAADLHAAEIRLARILVSRIRA